MAIQKFVNKARDTLRGRKPQIDKGLDKAQQAVSDKTGGKYDERLSSARRQADKLLGDDSTGPETGDQPDAEPRDRPGDDPGSEPQR